MKLQRHPQACAHALWVLLVALFALVERVAAAPAEPWPVAGRQGMIRFVIVPNELAREREAYAQQIEQLCEPGQSCFLNFYTNTSGAPLAVPLPDAIDREATVLFRRSLKQGAELMRWSCRLQVAQGDCF